MIVAKKHYRFVDSYRILVQGLSTMRFLSRARAQGDLNKEFIERIMLAVTEVNGCAACSYAHTKMALESGMSPGEVQAMLAGIIDDVPANEVPAIMFAQHYADTGGNPTRESWERIVETYGERTAQGILGAIRAIMIGNVYGIPVSALISRIKGNPDPGSSLLNEIGLPLTSIPALPVAVLHALVSRLARVPLISFPGDAAAAAQNTQHSPGPEGL